MSSHSTDSKLVYVIGAGLSAGLGFPTISSLLFDMWEHLEEAGIQNDLSKIIRFHHPDFNPGRRETFPNIEQLLSELQANTQLFDSSRPATGNFTNDILQETQTKLLLALAEWFHRLQKKALKRKPIWLRKLVKDIQEQKAKIVSFNWDLVLDELLFGPDLKASDYGFGTAAIQLIKPHGSLNWYEHKTGRFLSDERKFTLTGSGNSEVLAFNQFRAVKSTKREYMPLIVPPVYMKNFESGIFQELWRQTVSVISQATEVRFVGYSLPDADFHARFILRCGFHNQEFGALKDNGDRADATGRAKVVIVDPDDKGKVAERVERAVGWRCTWVAKTAEQWIMEGGLANG